MTDKQKPRRKPLKIVLVACITILSLCAITVGVGVSTGKLDPHAPWFGLGDIGRSQESIEQEAAKDAKALTSEDTRQDGSTPDNTVDLRGARMEPDGDESYPDSDQIRRMDVQTYDGRVDGRFRIDSVGLNAPLNSMSVVDGIATPPGFRAAYLLRGYGTSPSTPDQGTVFVMMHSAMGYGLAPGNYLINKRTGNSKVATGTLVTVDGVNYRITGHENVKKNEINTRDDIWANTPNRLVIITCQQMNGKHTTHNSVFYAERA